MVKNFIAMPLLLKLLTAASFVVPIFCAASLFPHDSIDVFGQQMTASEWWLSGAGLITLVASFVMLAAAFLMLRRSPYGRPTYILGGLVISLSAPFISILTGIGFQAEVPSLISDLVVTAFIGLYLYRSSAVRNYFATETGLD